MAKDDSVNTIWVSLGMTKNLGNYESARIDAGARVVVDDIEDEEAWADLWAKVDAQIEKQLVEIADALGEK